MNRNETFAYAANTHPNAAIYNDLFDCGCSKKDSCYKLFGWESGTTEPRMQQYIRRTKDLSKVFKQGLADDEPQYVIPHVRINMKSPWFYADCCSMPWYTWSKNFLGMLRNRDMSWKMSLKPVPTARGDLVTETKAAQNGWSPILKCCCYWSPLKLSSNCQVKFAHIHLFLDQYCSSPEITFLCPWDVPSTFLPFSVHHRWKSKHLCELSSALLSPGSLAICNLSDLLLASFILSSSLTTQDQPITFSGTRNLIVLHYLMVGATAQHLQPHASFHWRWEELKGSPACPLGEILTTVGKFIGKNRSCYFAKFFWQLAFSTTLPRWLHAMPQGSCNDTLLSMCRLQKGHSHIFGAALCEGVWVLLSMPACPHSKYPQVFPIQPLLLALEASI